MTESALRHRLLAILAADAVAFSRLVSADERAAVLAISAARDVFRKHTALAGGRVVDTAGDSVLAVFDTGVGAVSAALAAQRSLLEANASLGADQRMHFRIGVHLGDVVEKLDGTVYGDGVNIAARLQALAAPGGVVVSAPIHGIVRGKVKASFADLGEQLMKNIEHPVRAFAIELAEPSRPVPSAPSTETARAVVDMSMPVPGFGGQPAIAVLPFANLSAEQAQDHFADGLAEDILTRLAMWRLFPVIAKNSSFRYRGVSADVRDVGRNLGARWILEGSVRRSQSKVRVAVQLVDAETAHTLWAERYDRELHDLFELQDELTEGIVGALQERVGRVIVDRVRLKAPTNLDAWETVHRAVWHIYRMTKEDAAEAKALCERALGLNPEMPLALAALANVYRIEALFMKGGTSTSFAKAVAYASRAYAADENDPWTCGTLGLILASVGRHDEGKRVSCRAIELNPSGTLGYNGLGTASLYAGEWSEGIRAMSTAVRISPADPMLSASLTALAFNHLMACDYERAVDVGRLAVQHQPVFPGAPRILASALGHAGRIDEAAIVLGAERSRAPGSWSERSFRATLPFREEAMLQHFLGGLRAAGWSG